jgi:hypothetical protein
VAEILHYEERVRARAARRMELLGRRLDDHEPQASTFTRQQRTPVT